MNVLTSALRSLAPGIFGAVLLVGAVLADGAHHEFHGPADEAATWLGPDRGETALRQLSPGNRQVAESLYRAQRGQPGSRSLEEIAAAKVAGASWSKIFHEIKSRGLLREHTLGQVIGTYSRMPGHAETDFPDPRQSLPDQSSDRTGSERQPIGGPAFRQLSPGNQKIAMSLFAAQTSGSARRSLEEIASSKRTGTRWSAIFRAMKADGLVAEQNLGQVLNRHASRNSPGAEAADDRVVVRSPAELYAEARFRAHSRRLRAARSPKSRVKPVARAPVGERPSIAVTSETAAAAPVLGKRTAGRGPGRRYLPSLGLEAQLAHRPHGRRLASSQDPETTTQ